MLVLARASVIQKEVMVLRSKAEKNNVLRQMLAPANVNKRVSMVRPWEVVYVSSIHIELCG